jgi:hypothetical protein
LEQNVNQQPVSKIPKLRRVIEITDFDSAELIVHKLELYKTGRIDCYDVYVDGAIWKKRIGWSQILAGIRKAMFVDTNQNENISDRVKLFGNVESELILSDDEDFKFHRGLPSK